MAIPKLPKNELANHHLLVKRVQHKKIHSIAKKNKMRVSEVVDIFIRDFENCYPEDKISV